MKNDNKVKAFFKNGKCTATAKELKETCRCDELALGFGFITHLNTAPNGFYA